MSCRSFARQVASGAERAGGSGRGLGFWFHWAICRFCRQYWAELQLIAAEAANISESPVDEMNMREMKDRLRENIRRQIQ